MKKILNRFVLLSLCLCAILSLELFVLLDVLVAYHGGMLPLYTPVLFVPAVTLLLTLCFRKNWKKVLVLAAGIPAVICVIAGLGYLGWRSFAQNAVYENPDSGKHQFYGDRNVMVIVPHQDDELNLLGGVMEEYVRYGSELRVVFVTNGDYYYSAETRMEEALAVCETLGIPEDHVIFLGYGNEWETGKPHIYNSDPDAVSVSYAGKTEVYGTKVHAAYREGAAYTLCNLEQDLKSVILENRPQIIFCSDYDHHIDHKATSLLFEKVMGQLLKENPEYTPVVYKGYAYGTAWEAAPDYYADNVLSIQDPFQEPYSQKPAVYQWQDRVRMPVAGDTQSRSLMGAPAYKTLSLHDSQGVVAAADRVINGDRVFWQRHTNSLLLQSEVTASSGETECLHDFMLIDNDDLIDAGRLPYDGVWIPEETDAQRTVSVMLAEPSNLAEIVLYDHPSPEENVKNALITFDDGTSLETGPLDPNGAATSVLVNKAQVSGFAVILLETEGTMAGLSEIEAFSKETEAEGAFVKLMDDEESFVYDYLTAPDGYGEFSLYTHGDLPEVSAAHYSLGTVGDVGTAELDGDIIRVHCPVGETMVLNVSCKEAGVSDSIVIRNPGRVVRIWSSFWAAVEEEVYCSFVQADGTLVPRLNLTRIWKSIGYLIRHI